MAKKFTPDEIKKFGYDDLVSTNYAYVGNYLSAFGGNKKDPNVVRENIEKIRKKLYLNLPFVNKREKSFEELSEILVGLGISENLEDSYLKIDLLTRFVNSYGEGFLEFKYKELMYQFENFDNPEMDGQERFILERKNKKIKSKLERELSLDRKNRHVLIFDKG